MSAGVNFGHPVEPQINKDTREVTLHDSDDNGAIVIAYLKNDEHPTFGNYATVTTKSIHHPMVKTVFSHLIQVIDSCLASKIAIPPIPLADYQNDCRLRISVDEKEDDVDHEKFIVFTVKATFEEQYKIPRHTLIYALSKLKEAHDDKMTAPAAA